MVSIYCVNVGLKMKFIFHHSIWLASPFNRLFYKKRSKENKIISVLLIQWFVENNMWYCCAQIRMTLQVVGFGFHDIKLNDQVTSLHNSVVV